jgi:hypothetical protein
MAWMLNFCFLKQSYASTPIHNCFNFLINGFNITFNRGPGAFGPGTMKKGSWTHTSYKETVVGCMTQQRWANKSMVRSLYWMDISKQYVANSKWTFLASLTKSVSNLSSTFYASLSEGCTMTPSFSHMSSLCHLTCLVVFVEINNRFNRGVIGKYQSCLCVTSVITFLLS